MSLRANDMASEIYKSLESPEDRNKCDDVHISGNLWCNSAID